MAKNIGHHQQFVSRYETGERRLDVIEFVDIATSLGLDPIAMLESAALDAKQGSSEQKFPAQITCHRCEY